jgi:hypothetical protein
VLGNDEPDDWPSLNDSYTPQRGLIALEETGLLADDGVAAVVDLDPSYIHGDGHGRDGLGVHIHVHVRRHNDDAIASRHRHLHERQDRVEDHDRPRDAVATREAMTHA